MDSCLARGARDYVRGVAVDRSACVLARLPCVRGCDGAHRFALARADYRGRVRPATGGRGTFLIATEAKRGVLRCKRRFHSLATDGPARRSATVEKQSPPSARRRGDGFDQSTLARM